MKHRKNARFPAVQYRLLFIGFLWTRPVDKQRFQGYTLPDEIRDPQRIRQAPEKDVEVDTMRRYANLAVAYAVHLIDIVTIDPQVKAILCWGCSFSSF